MWLDVNGKRMQTRQHAHDDLRLREDRLVRVSQYMTLLRATSSPPARRRASALGMKPTPVFLKPGDVMTLGIQGLGEQKQKVVAYSG